MKFIAGALLLLALTHGAWVASAQPFDARVAMVFTDKGFSGTSYKAQSLVRTANHVLDPEILEAVGWPGQVSAARLVCRDAPTDSATIESDVPLQNYGVGNLPRLGDEVRLFGWRQVTKQYFLVEHTTTVFGYVMGLEFGGVAEPPHIVGPLMIVSFRGEAYGMSGGPIISRGTAVATMVAFDGNYIYAVPIQSQKCPIR